MPTPPSTPEATSARTLTPEPLAHLTEDGRPHLLIEHLREVSTLAARFAEVFGSAEWGRLAGLWHDLGKYEGQFQKMIREANGFEAHIETDESAKRDHSSAGAIHACKLLGKAGTAIAFAIAGHHAGLANHIDLHERIQKKTDHHARALRDGAPKAILEASPPQLPAHLVGATPEHLRRREMWTRMLFSALCDADFLDTEAFYDQDRAALRGGAPPLPKLHQRLTTHLDALEAQAPVTDVNRVRAEVRKACLDAASRPPGVYSLTVPTGGGKTLASLAFGLAHADKNGLRRIVVAIPFTSILEQSAEAYRKALGEEAVLEHHSAFDPARETPKNRVAAENWDAPVVVTTTVQLFESLFANRPSACRKLHRLAQSIIVLDEAQTLPPLLLAPILDGLRTLVRDFGATVIIATATQPAFGASAWLGEGLSPITEIVPPALRAFERLRRVRTVWPKTDEAISYEALAGELAEERDVLAIVHRRADARALCEALDRRLGHEETIHLSALLCPAHRSRILAEIKARKASGQAVRLVSTQLIEAGVDVDFAIVYRALGGLDALAQAAGRCNREGKLEGLGELRVFHAPTEPPRGVPIAALGVTRQMLRSDPALDLFMSMTFKRYFDQLYSSRSLDERSIQEARAQYRFKDVAEKFKLIEDDWSAPLVVPYGEAKAHLDALQKEGPSRSRLRSLQRFTINVRKLDRDAFIKAGYAIEIAETVVALQSNFAGAYHPRFGLVPEHVGRADPGAYIIGP